MEVQVNFVAVLAAMASSMVVGAIWYARKVFGNTWIKLARIDMSKNTSIAKPMITTVIVSTITAYVLAHVAYLAHQFYGNSFFADSVTTAFWMWLGFTAARFITHDAFEGRPMKLTAITIGSELVTLLVMGVVIGAIGI